ncbi:MAG: sulfite exporter TauE/SafE family protein [Armatimonadetes bacterium]|nr:sulfite exporter TauE/SafE family protein [Armatimonadota bacterium]
MDYINQIGGQLGHASPVAYALVLAAGVLIGLTPCNLPMVPLVIGYVAGYGSDRKRSLVLVSSFSLGAAFSYGVLGVVAALVGAAMKRVLGSGWDAVLGVLCVFTGLMMAGLIRLPVKGGSVDLSAPWAGGFWAAFALGAVVSLASSACCLGPVGSICMYSAVDGRVLHGAATLFAFGLGKSIPLLLIGAGVGTFRGFAKATRWAHYIEVASGAVLIVVGFYFLRKAF